MKNILIIAPQYVGDSILAIPFLRELRRHFENSTIDVVTKNAGILVFSKCPYINNIYDEKDLKKNFYDKAYVLKRSLSAALLAKKLNIQDTISFGGQFREFFLKKVVKYNAFEKHESEHFFDILRAENIEINDKSLEYWVDEISVSNIKQYFSDKKKALIVTSSSTPVKQWHNNGFNEVIKHLKNNNYDCFIAGTEAEYDFNNKFKDAINLCGKLSFEETTALISEMDLVFGIDSGFCHMASAFNKKTMVLFGPTSKKQWAVLGNNSNIISLDLNCAPCKKPKKCKKDFICLKNLKSEDVISKLEDFIS